jgi:hypothetical protein
MAEQEKKDSIKGLIKEQPIKGESIEDVLMEKGKKIGLSGEGLIQYVLKGVEVEEEKQNRREEWDIRRAEIVAKKEKEERRERMRKEEKQEQIRKEERQEQIRREETEARREREERQEQAEREKEKNWIRLVEKISKDRNRLGEKN